MALKVTRGGLQPASLINEVTNETVYCTFNPFEYTLTKQNQWSMTPTTGGNVPEPSFQSGGPQTLRLTLYFDTTMDNSDVRTYTDALWRMMMVVDANKNPKSGKSEPPKVSFKWGRLYFTAYLTNMSQKFTLFKEDSTPIRCQVDITLEQKIDIDDYKDQAPLRGIQGAPKTANAVEGDRLDNLLSRVAEEGVSALRRVAEENGIDNPLNIPPGSKLRI
ncbi:MAG: hypothetical protein U0694_20740 [Anaerolineae bacterium]